MPGLGWLLKRSLYKTELEPNWPTPEKVKTDLYIDETIHFSALASYQENDQQISIMDRNCLIHYL